MPSTAIFCGILLSLIGIIGALAGYTSGKVSATALIPLGFGVLLLLLGVLARTKQNLRKHLMHAAVALALLGFLGSLFSPGIRGVIATGEISNYASFLAQFSMALICLLFVILGVKSFIDARRSRNA